MPKKAIDYSKCEMYKIVCKDEELNYIYVGHTTDFTKRKSGHKTKSRTSELKLYKTIREHGGWDNFKMLQIETFPCNNRREAEAREDKLMTELKANMNHYRASRSKKEFNQDNKEKIREQNKTYYEANKEHVRERHKQYHEANKEQLYERMKQYQETNKEHIREQKKTHYEANKDKILEQQAQRRKCLKDLVS
jgi:hypothetical protein